MIKKLVFRIRQYVGDIDMKAAYWTQFGAMALPLGVALIVIWPDSVLVAGVLMVVGLFSFIAGWAYTIQEEHLNVKKAKEETQQRRLDEKRRQREHRENLVILFELGTRHRLSTVRLKRIIEDLEEKEKEENDYEL